MLAWVRLQSGSLGKDGSLWEGQEPSSPGSHLAELRSPSAPPTAALCLGHAGLGGELNPSLRCASFPSRTPGASPSHHGRHAGVQRDIPGGEGVHGERAGGVGPRGDPTWAPPGSTLQ